MTLINHNFSLNNRKRIKKVKDNEYLRKWISNWISGKKKFQHLQQIIKELWVPYKFFNCIIKSGWEERYIWAEKYFGKKEIISKAVSSHRKIQNLESESTSWNVSQCSQVPYCVSFTAPLSSKKDCLHESILQTTLFYKS